MTITSRLTRIGRLTIAPLKGFFTLKTETVMSDFEPEHDTWWTYTKALIRRDIAFNFEPFKFAVRAFKQERARPS